MKHKCSTCPFHEDTPERIELANMVRGRSLQMSQICHHPRLKGKKESHLCRGARDFQIQILYGMGLLREPTDEAFAEASINYCKRLQKNE